ncbi:hypothetical protein RirG_152670 [Rhizophagus irregularis DAOM 197198w]|uniref:F-box domain-containing protein n=1 Tax=Rhizophagus irregularis (strain DAOM 197198w) TaxID=1432141 RepID=A0A015M968_RHIIW|nr:hypothetical protein RirG_152670 [Rhizophagus irregularis DAOM 197198w]
MSKLNKDILFLLFEELQDDSKSLFSCLMVNRLWCETVIPILWRNPWNYHEFLTRLGIQLLSISCQSLLFDYLSFCRSINVNIINSIISIGSSSVDHRLFLQQEFYGLVMKKCSELKYLDMRSLEYQIFYFPEAKLRFESLYELKCDTSIDISYFYGLARICQHIQKLTIINNINKTNLGIVKLIEVQKNLKYFEWMDEFDGFISKIDPYKEILLALEKKADTIDHLEIYLDYLDRTLQKVLPKLHKLKSLITSFEAFSEEQSKKCVYRDLEVFRVEYYCLKANSIIIENSGGHIKKITIDPCEYYYYEYYKNFNEYSLIFIRKIYENCPLIEYLSLVFSSSKQHFSEFEKLLKVCQNLKSLLLIICIMDELETDEKNLENGKEVLNTLIRSAPTNLKEIRFFDHIKFSLEALEEFLENWKGRPLSILTSDPLYEGENYVKLINKYKNNGIIKSFRHESSMNVGDMDFKI